MSLPRVPYPVCPCCVLPPPASIPKLLGTVAARCLPCPGALGASSQPCPKGKGSGMQGS